MTDSASTDDDTAERAAAQLWSAWSHRDPLDGLPEPIRPTTLAQAYAIQAPMDGHAGRRVGWKLAATAAAGRAALGVEQPLAGPLYARFALAPDSTLEEFAAIPMAIVEAEFGLVIDRDLPASDGPYDRDAILAALGSLVPAIEIPDTRYRDHRSAGAAQLTADAALAGLFLLGEPVGAYHPAELPGHEVVLTTPAGTVTGTGAQVLGDPVEAVRWLADELGAHGLGLAAGDIVITGAAAAMHAPGSGPVTADFGTLCRLGLTLS